MKITKNIISREKAMEIAPDYVNFVTDEYSANPDEYWSLSDKILPLFDKLKRKQKCITYVEDQKLFVLCTVASLSPNPHGDGPKVRVTNGEYSWRVDGSNYAYPV